MARAVSTKRGALASATYVGAAALGLSEPALEALTVELHGAEIFARPAQLCPQSAHFQLAVAIRHLHGRR
jgi:hypothetical protein